MRTQIWNAALDARGLSTGTYYAGVQLTLTAQSGYLLTEEATWAE